MIFIMSKEVQKSVTFYLYDQNDNIDKRNKIIYSPFNKKTTGRTREEDTYLDPVVFEFIWGIFETDDPQSIEALDLWAKGGGKLSNGKKFYPDNVHRIKREKPQEKTNEKIVIEKVEVQVLPRIVVDNMTVNQLQQVTQAFGIEIPVEVKQWENIKEQIIRLLEEGGHIK